LTLQRRVAKIVCREKEEEVVRDIGICDTKSIGKKLVRAETKILFWL
jgi:hypothetical protein